MRIGRLWIVVVVLLLMPATARAHDHTADFFGGVCYANASKLFGPHVSVAITIPTLLERDLSVVGDLATFIGTHDEQELTRVTSMVGIRYTPTGMRLSKHLAAFHFLIGSVRDGGLDSSTKWASSVGGSWEYLRNDKSAAGFAFRAQGDYVISGGENFPRFSAGIVYRLDR
jgi:hypothetical protein